MSDSVLTQLEVIKPNPFQPRQGEDPEVVKQMAINIYSLRDNGNLGLMQVPVARRMNSHGELVFGHTRFAAFKMLATKGVPEAGIDPDERFKFMPLMIQTLTDRQACEQAIAENLKRSDLNPIETASALDRYMKEFKASSVEAGQLFGLSDSTVRGKVRLLELPKPAQEQLAAGTISEGTARALLSMQKVADTGHMA